MVTTHFVILSEAFSIDKTEVSLDLASKGISNAGATAVAQALKHNTSLNTIDLRGKKIGNDGAKALAEVRR